MDCRADGGFTDGVSAGLVCSGRFLQKRRTDVFGIFVVVLCCGLRAAGAFCVCGVVWGCDKARCLS